MGWEVLIPIIAQYGLPLAEKLFQKWTSGADPTLEDFQELRAMAGQTGQDRMKAALVKAGIPLDSEQAKKLLGLTQ